LLTKRATSHGVVNKDRKRHRRGKENAGLERHHLTTTAAPFIDTPTRWLDDRTAVVVAPVAGAAGCDERSPPTQERPQQFHCTCERHGATSPAHVPEESAAMIGDYTAPCCLPLSKNLRGEIQFISPATAADLLRGQFDSTIESFHIVDCRYPYEYVGGHIQGAENICTEEQLTLRFMKEPLNRSTHCCTWRAGDKRRHVIVFHCEFSSHRAPNMWKLLRRLDREQNMSSYPGLYYPEMYVIEGGYKAFFNQFRELCDPQNYKPMRGPEYRSSKEFDGAAGKRSRRHRMRSRLAMQDGCPPPLLHYDDDDL
jgi:rhodanese-related sulfurtransferase